MLEERMARFEQADLYVVITQAFCAGRTAVEVLVAALDAGVRLVQLREKEWTDKALYEQAARFRYLTAEKNALLIIDDRVDLALASGADGVHLGQHDLPVEAARILAPELIVGCSTHSVEQAIAAQTAGASYVNIGPIFATQTKTGTAAPLGLEAIRAAAGRLAIPWTVMGGIKESNIEQVLEKGARRAAVVTAVTAADDVTAACTGLRAKILHHRAGAVPVTQAP
jgi:thiamine-phosphate pyrophosphorylase